MNNEMNNRKGNTLFEKLKRHCASEWEAYCTHEFVKQIGSGILPKECFRHYLMQDYIFLIHFSRAWALAAYKSETLSEMQAAAETLNAHLNFEMDLHVTYCAGWGITKDQLLTVEEARANMAYTRYVLERGMAGDVLDLQVALAPCVIGYAEISRALLLDPATKLAGNPYREWIEMYGGKEYQKVAENAVNNLEQLARARMGEKRLVSLVKTFRQATSLEIGFWEMGLHLLN